MNDQTGRPRAASFYMGLAVLPLLAALGGCVLPSFSTEPLQTIVSVFTAEDDADVSARAAAIPYASIHFVLAGRGGLIVLAEEADTLTFWQMADRATIVFNLGYLDHTAGLDHNLLETQIVNADTAEPAQPWLAWTGAALTYSVVRRWEAEDGEILSGRAQARLQCDKETQRVKLPLTTLELLHCQETLSWSDGSQTHTELWISPQARRIWQGKSEPYPGANSFEWQVARPWW